MNILLINDFIDEGGGGALATQNIASLLQKKGYGIEIFGANRKYRVLNFIRSWFSFYFFIKTVRIIKKKAIDILHIHGFSRAVSLSPILAAKLLKIPVVLTIHDFQFTCLKLSGIRKDGNLCNSFSLKCILTCKSDRNSIFWYPYYLFKWLKLVIQKWVIRKFVDVITCPSRALTKEIKSSFDLPNVLYVPNFMKVSEYDKNQKVKSRDFLFVGRISWEKGVDQIIKAVEVIVNKYNRKDIRVTVVGDGDRLDECKQLVEQKDLVDNITFTGQLPNKVVINMYERFLAVLMPSMCKENNPLVALEAMNRGKPLITTDIGGYSDLVANDETGFLFSLGDNHELARKMLILLDNPDLALRMGHSGREKLLTSFSSEYVYQALYKIYTSLI